MIMKYKALEVRENGKKYERSIIEKDLYDLPDNDTLIKLKYSSLTNDEFLINASTDFGGLQLDGFGDGIWINDTLEINGSTTLPPQNADWVLYDVTDPYTEWPIACNCFLN